MARFLHYGQDILVDVLSRSGQPTDLTGLPGISSQKLANAKEFVQRAYNDVLVDSPWFFALKDPPGVFQALPQYTDTAVITLGSQTITLTNTYTTSLVGWWFMWTDEQLPYRIITHSPPSNVIGLDLPYQPGDITFTGGSGCNVTLFKDEYQLPADCMKIWRVWNRTNPWATMDLITEGEMSEEHPNRDYGVWPEKAAQMRDGKLRIIPWPQLNYCNIEFEYTQKPAQDLTFDESDTTDVLVIPDNDLHIVSDVALILMYELFNDQRLADLQTALQIKMDSMRTLYVPIGKVRAYIRAGGGIWR